MLTAPRSSRRERANSTGWWSGESPVAHRSAAVTSAPDIPGSCGASVPVTTPGRRPGLACEAAPAAHSASRRSVSKQSKAPAVARASTAGWVAPVRRTRSSIES